MKEGSAVTTKRKVKSIAMPDVAPMAVDSPQPTFEWVDPRTLLVDEAYQRTLSERSVTLIRKIVGAWEWSRFKPPVVAQGPDGYEIIDGQHTAIAACSHPGIDKIPVMVVFAPLQSTRALAFVGHNRDRLAITPLQLHFAAVAAGDEDALTILQVCERAGIRVLKGPPGAGMFKPGDTMAVGAIGSLINRRGAMRARVILQAIGDARCAPIQMIQVKAVERLLHDAEYRDQIEASDITTAILKLGQDAEAQARVFAATHDTKLWHALASVLFREARRGRRRAA